MEKVNDFTQEDIEQMDQFSEEFYGFLEGCKDRYDAELIFSQLISMCGLIAVSNKFPLKTFLFFAERSYEMAQQSLTNENGVFH